MNVEMVFLPISFDGKEYLDIKELSHEQFYVELKNAKNLPKTSAVNQTAFEEVFKDVKEKGDEMIVMPISNGISATTGQAIAAKEAVGYDKIHIVDTRCVAMALSGLVMQAVRLRNEKKNVQEIIAELERLAPKAKLYACLDTLKYLRAGGRISGTSAVVGTLLGIKPIAGLNAEGKVTSFHKTIGMRKAHDWVMEKLKNADPDLPIYYGFSDAKEVCEKFKERVMQAYPDLKDGGDWNMPATISVHSGPGATGLAFFEK